MDRTLNIPHFEKMLRDKLQQLQGDVARLDGAAKETGELEVRDAAEDAAVAQGAAESLQEASMQSDVIELIDDALQRLTDKTYGECTICGREIGKARLEAVPWTPYCLDDQNALEESEAVEHNRDRTTPTL